MVSEGWAAVGGHAAVIQQLKEMVLLPLQYPEVFKHMGITPPRSPSITTAERQWSVPALLCCIRMLRVLQHPAPAKPRGLQALKHHPTKVACVHHCLLPAPKRTVLLPLQHLASAGFRSLQAHRHHLTQIITVHARAAVVHQCQSSVQQVRGLLLAVMRL